MKKIYPFTTTEIPALEEVGGKALSLIKMTREGMPVPPGFVLAVNFFEQWFKTLQNTPEWELVQKSSLDKLGQATQALQSLCLELQLDHDQQKELNIALETVQASKNLNLFAIRSSSPEEDLEGASFAGIYETTLGVTAEVIETALRHSFASCFDERVFIYKKERGFPMNQPRIAVIVQQQIDADSAGVAFSLNPLNNCFDEAVIHANYGLGESVVSGEVTPDVFVVDKVKRTIINTKIGGKEIVINLMPKGGTTKSQITNSDQACINPEQVLMLTEMLNKVESYYQKPVDIEWCFAGGELYLLQVRPITTYLPLPEEMLTPPDDLKQLYANATLIEQGIEDPLSVAGTNFLVYILKEMTGPFGGDITGIDGLVFTAGGRYYVNFSYIIKMLGMKTSLAQFRFLALDDINVIEMLKKIDLKQYTPKKLPKKLKRSRYKMIITLLPALLSTLKAYRKPEALILKYRQALPNQLEMLKDISKKDLPIEQLATDLTAILNFFIMKYGFPMLIAPQLAQNRIKRMFKKEAEELHDELIILGISLPGNKTTEMGELMYNLASFNEIKIIDSVQEFISQLKQRSLSSEFLKAWDQFVKEFGFRCFREIDVATPRPNELPAMLFEQLKNLSLTIHKRKHSTTVFEEARLKREAAYQILHEIAVKKGKRKAKAFEKLYKILITLGGYRETPKHYVIMVVDLFRKRLLEVAQTLVSEHRLDYPDQIFDLTIADIDQALMDLTPDLRTLAQKNTLLINKIKNSHIIPLLLDSRGRIFYSPQKKATAGELIGMPISPGIGRGKVKVLHQIDEKKLLPGEILVARATDPGWTPLFINAEGIILEIGSALQHGAVVAREYGIPCVSGVEEATKKLKDGQLVEVDGSNGIVRILADEDI